MTGTAWLGEELETMRTCPLCRATDRHLEHDALEDLAFRSAPGRWQLWRCERCTAGWLDPRPTPQSIGRAYDRYYTHQSTTVEREPYSQLGFIRKLRRRLVNGYVNQRFGTNEIPYLQLGHLVTRLIRSQQIRIDREFRHLPDHGGELLDVGCGSGDFLLVAQTAGWSCAGVEPDAAAVNMARARGLDIRLGSLEQFDGVRDRFDVITMSHVIEHFHDPPRALDAAYRLLKPGGRLWLETPNLDGVGHRRFGVAWRGLEAPRHLVLFTRRALVTALGRAGFGRIERLKVPSPVRFLTLASIQMQRHHDPAVQPQLTRSEQLTLAGDQLRAYLKPEWSDFITVQAFKPN